MADEPVYLFHLSDPCYMGQCGSCKGEWKRFYINSGKVKKGASPVVYTGEITRCPHHCHGHLDKTNVVKKRKPRRKS